MSIELIAQERVQGSSQNDIVFSNIPQDKTDLLLLCSLRTSGGVYYSDIDIDFNGESATKKWLGYYAISNTPSANSLTNNINIIGPAAGPSVTTNGFSLIELYIPNYTSSNVKILNSNAVAPNFSTTQYNLSYAANSITNSAAITSITLYRATLLFGSTVYLYGITAGSDGVTTVS